MSKRLGFNKIGEAWGGWFAPGIGVKRWFVTLAIGAIIAGIGIGAFIVVLGQQEVLAGNIYGLITLNFLPVILRILIPLFVGGFLIFISVFRLSKNIVAPFRSPGVRVVDSLQSYSQRSRGPRIVAIGGGTGLPALLRGMTEYTNNITAVVTVADDGGSSGRLRREMGVLPPGDFRNNMAALAQDEALMTQLLQYRFGGQLVGDDNGRNGLQGHAFGNLLLVALTGITGSFDEALVAAGRVLAVRGRVLPSTLANVTLVADVIPESQVEAQRIVGESSIPKVKGRVEMVALEPADVPAYPPSVKAILQADLVIIGPGSLYTSIIPNLLVKDITRALQRTKAKKIYVCNLAVQPGETDNYNVADHVMAIERHTILDEMEDGGIIDVVLANNNLSVPPSTGGGYTVFVQPDGPDNVSMVTADLVDEERPWRHDSQKLSKVVIEFV
jgi:uncharacterized cofD-like protein